MVDIYQLADLPEPWADPHLSAVLAASLLAQGRRSERLAGWQGQPKKLDFMPFKCRHF
jgi:hypothetical protein